MTLAVDPKGLTVHVARPSTRLLAALLTLGLALAALAGPASAQEAPPAPPDREPAPATEDDVRGGSDGTIIGGTKAAPGSWPSVVALMYTDPFWPEDGSYQICGGTIIDPSWVLTAAHCVSDGPGHVQPARAFKVLVGTQDLRSGGQQIQVAEIFVRPSYSPQGISNDVALLRLSRPTDRARPLEVASPTDIPWSGANLTTAGWGASDVPGQYAPDELRQVDVPALSGVECQTALTDAEDEFGTPPYHSSHLCTGPLGLGGRGPCYGDSGGPLVWERDGRKILVGIVSWGAYCASPETPSVFSKVASASRWIAQTIQYGPHRSGRDFAFATAIGYLNYDPYWGPGDLPNPGEPGDHIAALHTVPGVTRRDATIVRLYDAVLGRRAELYGYQYWRERMFYGSFETGQTYGATKVAEVMARSAEFKAEYGMLGDEDFIEQIYLNVLDRNGSDSDVDYWVGRLTAGASRGAVVAQITESAENRARTQAEVDVQVAFMNMVQRAPAAYEIAQWESRPLAELARHLVHSVAYARLWSDIYWGE